MGCMVVDGAHVIRRSKPFIASDMTWGGVAATPEGGG